jgi:hypothetical protein
MGFCHIPGTLAQEYLAGVVNGENGFALGTAETARFEGLEFFGTDGTGKNLGKQGNRFRRRTAAEKIDGIINVILNIEKLGETEELEHLIYLGLYFQQYQIPAPGLYGLEKSGKRANTGGGYIIETAALKNQTDKAAFDCLGDPLLKIIGVIRINIPGKVENKASFHLTYLLKLYLEAFIFLVIKSRNNIVVCHDASFIHNSLQSNELFHNNLLISIPTDNAPLNTTFLNVFCQTGFIKFSLNFI